MISGESISPSNKQAGGSASGRQDVGQNKERDVGGSLEIFLGCGRLTMSIFWRDVGGHNVSITREAGFL